MTGAIPALDVRSVSKSFGGFRALDQVSLTLHEGERRALIGPNGAGKTTLFNVVSARLRCDSGEVCYFGKPIGGLPGHEVCRLGIARTFQITSIYPRLTCMQNVQTALFARRRRSHWLLRHSRSVDSDEAVALLQTVGIAALAAQRAADISYGDQKRLELAMVLGVRPRLLLLDEPTAGVEVNTRREIVELVKRLCREHALTLLFCEHDMDAVFRIADRITVLHQGRVLTEGTVEEIVANPQVRSIYLGTAHEKAV